LASLVLFAQHCAAASVDLRVLVLTQPGALRLPRGAVCVWDHGWGSSGVYV